MQNDSTTAVPDLKADTHVGKEAFSSEADDEIITTSQSEFDDTTLATTSSQPASKLNSKSAVALVDERIRTDDVPVTEIPADPPSKSELRVLDPVGLSSRDTTELEAVLKKSQSLLSDDDSREVQEAPLATSQVKKEIEQSPIPSSPQTRSSLEDNIVLGVALDGSKRTLPIDEGEDSSPPPAQMKKLAPCRNGNGSSSAAEDKTEDHILTFPGDQGR